MSKLLKPEEVAAMLNVEKSTIYSWTHLKKIPHVKMGRLLRFREHEIKEWLDKRNRIEDPIPHISI
jgi:excisionase family DNA binding protein